jgi:transmembrane sensor
MMMSTKSTPQEIDRLAAEWVARPRAELSADARAALEAWLEADPRHLGAYAKAEAVLARLDQAGAAGADALRPHPAASLVSPLKRRTVLGGSIAAGLAVLSGGAFGLWRLLREEGYSTRVGETKEAILSDGSIVTLNTNSQVLVNYSKAARQIRLVQGEALFDVAKNRRRPFIVTAGDTQVRAVGTSFTVRILPQQPVQVLVREGVVEIRRPGVPEAPPVRVAANSVAIAPPQAPISSQALPRMQVARELAWRAGHIAFDNEPLADAAREFARYSEVEIRVAPELESQTVTGLYLSNDPVGFAKAVAISLNLRVDVVGHEVRLSRQ